MPGLCCSLQLDVGGRMDGKGHVWGLRQQQEHAVARGRGVSRRKWNRESSRDLEEVNSRESKLTDRTLANHVLLLHRTGSTTALCKNSGSSWLSTAALFSVCVEFDEFAEK